MTILRSADVALAYHCRLAAETIHPRFSRVEPAGYSVVLTVNSGYE
jgi:hypothetical protein